MSNAGKRRCPHCGAFLKLRRGRFPLHTADCDGPGFPYDCPRSGKRLVDPDGAP